MSQIKLGKQLFRFRFIYTSASSEFSRTNLPTEIADRRNLTSLHGAEAGKHLLKLKCPLFSFREGTSKTKGQQSNYVQGIVADIDHLPDGYASFEELKESLSRRFPDAFVFFSPGGRVKVIWFVRAYRQDISDALAVEFLTERLPDMLSCIDTTSSALRTAFLDAGAIEAFQAWSAMWGADDSYLCDLPDPAVNHMGEREPSKHRYFAAPYERISLPMDQMITIASLGVQERSQEAFRQLFCILVSCPALLREEGMGLSSQILSEQLQVSQPTVSGWLNRLCDLHILKWTGNKSRAGVTAKHYVAKNLMLIDNIEAVRTKAFTPNIAGNMASLGSVVSKNLATYGEGYAFRQRVSFFAVMNGHSFEELCESIEAEVPAYFTTKEARSGGRPTNRRRKELEAAYRGALKKQA